MVTATEVDAEQELASLCGVLNASYARLVAIAAQALADESWAEGGIRSPEHWLTLRAGLSPFRARAVLAIARRAGELPTVMGEFADGQLSLDQVAVVARYAPAHVEASVAELAVNATVPQLRRALSRYSFDPPTEGTPSTPPPKPARTSRPGPATLSPGTTLRPATPRLEKLRPATPRVATLRLETPGPATPGVATPGVATPGLETPGLATPGLANRPAGTVTPCPTTGRPHPHS